MSLYEQIILLLLCTVIMIGVLRPLKLPPVIGYLLVGLILGPSGTSWLNMEEKVHLLAEFGIVFLLFTIGLEVSLTRLAALKKSVLLGGGMQVFVCTLVPGIIAYFLGMHATSAFLAAGALALSSTAVVAKQLAEQRELTPPHGQLSLAILLFQDLAAVPFLIITPVLVFGHSAGNLSLLLLMALGKGLLALAALLVAGRLILRPMFHQIARAKSSELFMFTALLVALAAAWLTERVGLSMALGAFIAGLVLGETEYRHQLAADIRPFRDVFLGLFFVTIGMLLDMNVLVQHWYWVAWLLISVIFFKFMLVAAVAHWSARLKTRDALRTGLVLAQVGEFGFVLLALGVSVGSIEKDYGQVILAAAIVSLFIAPLLVRHNEVIADAILKYFPKKQQQKPVEIRMEPLSGHVIICGYGRVGQTIARFLRLENVQVVAIDLDAYIVHEANLVGEQVFYGDAEKFDILEHVGIASAKMLVISYEDTTSAAVTLALIKSHQPDLPILVRTRDDQRLNELMALGATEVVPETLEAGLMLAAQSMLLLGMSNQQVSDHIWKARRERYRLLKGFFYGQQLVQLDDEEQRNQGLRAVMASELCNYVDRPLADLLRSCSGVTLVELLRKGEHLKDVDLQMNLEANDVLVLSGAARRVSEVEERLG